MKLTLLVFSFLYMIPAITIAGPDDRELKKDVSNKRQTPANGYVSPAQGKKTDPATSPPAETCDAALKHATTCCHEAPKCLAGKGAEALTKVNDFNSKFGLALPAVGSGKDISKLCKGVRALSSSAAVVTTSAEKKCKKTISHCQNVCQQEMYNKCRTPSGPDETCIEKYEKTKTKCSELKKFATSFKSAGMELLKTMATTEMCIRQAAGVRQAECVKRNGHLTTKYGCVDKEKCIKQLKGEWDSVNNKCSGKMICEEEQKGKWDTRTKKCLKKKDPTPNSNSRSSNDESDVTVTLISPRKKSNNPSSGSTTGKDHGGGGQTSSGGTTSHNGVTGEDGSDTEDGVVFSGSEGSGGGSLSNNKVKKGTGALSGVVSGGGGSKGISKNKKTKRGYKKRTYARYGRGGFGGYSRGRGESSLDGKDSFANLKLGKKEMDKMKAKQGAKIGVGNNRGMHQSLFMRVTHRYNSVCQQFKLNCE